MFGGKKLMAIDLPRLDDTFCRMLRLCSRIPQEFSTASLAKELDVTASYGVGPGRALARLTWDEVSSHLHTDFALKSAFAKDSVPKTNVRLSEYRKTLEVFRGAQVKAFVQGYFIVPLSSLPPTGGLIFAGSSGIKLRMKKTEIEVTGASLTFRNATIDQIRWGLIDDYVSLEGYADRTITIDDRYLTESFEIMDAAISSYVLGKKSDG